MGFGFFCLEPWLVGVLATATASSLGAECLTQKGPSEGVGARIVFAIELN